MSLAIFAATSCSKEPINAANDTLDQSLTPPVGDLASAKVTETTIETEPAIYTPITTFVNDNCGGYWEALPANYQNTTQKYPLIVFMTGVSRLGPGTPESLDRIAGPIHTYLLNQTFPANFTVNNENFSFIVISPQFIEWPDPDNVNSLLKYLSAKYRIDPSRIYLVGFSMGGGLCWDAASKYGSKIAAIVPICGQSDYSNVKAKMIAGAGVPVWAFHNDDDVRVSSSITKNYVNAINFFKGTPAPRLTLSYDTGGSHDAWSKACRFSYKEDGKNIYEWMLQYKRPL